MLLINGVPIGQIDIESMSETDFTIFEDQIWPSLEQQFSDIPKTAHWNDYLDPHDALRLQETHAKWVAARQKRRAEEELALPVEIDGHVYTKVCAFPVLWRGWEGDAEAWILERDGKRFVGTTSHGQAELVEAAFVSGKIAEYQDAINLSQAALALIDLPLRVRVEPADATSNLTSRRR